MMGDLLQFYRRRLRSIEGVRVLSGKISNEICENINKKKKIFSIPPFLKQLHIYLSLLLFFIINGIRRRFLIFSKFLFFLVIKF